MDYIKIPFPALEGVRCAARLISEVRRNRHLESMPSAEFPRGIKMRPSSAPTGADDAVRLDLWFGRRFHVTVHMAGYDSRYGTQWSPTGLRIRWTPDEVAGVHPMPYGYERWTIEFSAEEVRQIDLSARLRGAAQSEGDSLAKTDALLYAKAAPLRLAVERQAVWIETVAADSASREGCWIEDRRPFGERQVFSGGEPAAELPGGAKFTLPGFLSRKSQ